MKPPLRRETLDMATNNGPADGEGIGDVASVSARRIGLIADDHSSNEEADDLPAEVLTAFAGVDLIIHLGHMGVREILGRGVLDRLAAVAPVLAVRDYSTDNEGNPYITPADGERVAGLTRVIQAGDVRIGAVHNLARPPGPEIVTPPGGLPDLSGVAVGAALTGKFGQPVDVVAYAGSHRAAAITTDGVFFVNPGSPTYPKGPGRTPGVRALGNVGLLEITGRTVAFEIIELSTMTAVTTPEAAAAS
jgi:predicted phosphodiesterase